MKNQLGVVSSTRFAHAGDSGAVVLDDQNRVIGLFFGSNETGTAAFLCPIAIVLQSLHATMVDATVAGQSNGVLTAPAYNYRATPNALEPSVAPVPGVGIVRAVHRATDDLEEFEVGRAYMSLIGKHGTELRLLVSKNRRIASIWHRYSGPALMHNAIVAIQQGGPVLPTIVDGRPMAEVLDRFLSSIRRYASEALAIDLDRYGTRFAQIAGLSYDEMLDWMRAEVDVIPI
jgi:hypothetical protein